MMSWGTAPRTAMKPYRINVAISASLSMATSKIIVGRYGRGAARCGSGTPRRLTGILRCRTDCGGRSVSIECYPLGLVH
jgi:hypothetical protein